MRVSTDGVSTLLHDGGMPSPPSPGQASHVPSAESPGRGSLRRILLLPVWLPAWLYRAVPWIYLGNGATCLAGGLFLPDPGWMLPYAVLIGTGSIHAAVRIARARHRPSAQRQATPRGAAVPEAVPE